ncbi:MAG: hypothetical protein IJ067_02980 [Prevotella sp.]|nr:hypothetical protein [Prevotella sp.]
MKKMMIALVAMFVMTMSANAQSENNNSMTFERLSSYLELTVDQMEPVKTAMAQFTNSMEALYQIKDATKGMEAWGKIQERHMMSMKQILNEKQYEKYNQTFTLTAKNTAERMMNQQQANR